MLVEFQPPTCQGAYQLPRYVRQPTMAQSGLTNSQQTEQGLHFYPTHCEDRWVQNNPIWVKNRQTRCLGHKIGLYTKLKSLDQIDPSSESVHF